MEKLGAESLREILRHLELSEQIKLRRVCRDWMNTVDSMEKRLTISNGSKASAYEYNLNLVRDYVRASKIETVLGILKKPSLSNLKSLCIYNLDVSGCSALFCKAISFDRLNDLTISCIKNLDKEIKLRLPNVSKAFIGHLEITQITLDAPKLKDVKIRFGEGQFDLKFVHPSVERIELDKFSKCLESAELKESLQFLYCEKIEKVGGDFLKSFAKLKEIHFNYEAQLFGVLFEQKKRHHCDNLKIFFHGLRVDSSEEFEEWFGSELKDDRKMAGYYNGLIDLHIKNQTRLASRLPFYTSLGYDKIEDQVPQLPPDFFARLVNLSTITTRKQVKSVKEYLNFLRANFRDLTGLGALSDLQPQIFFNLLPLCCPSIRNMMLTRCDPYFYTGVEILHIDLNFIFKLKDLVLFSCNIELGDAFIRKIYKELKSIETLGFKYNDMHKIVKTKAPNEFQLVVGSLTSEPKFNNVNDLIMHLKTSQGSLLANLSRLRFV